MTKISEIQRLRTVDELRAQVKAWRAEGLRIGFVPTMGSLHAGHLALVEMALSQADRVVVSIFVNPTQFAPHEDLDAYPRTEDEDCAKLAEIGCHLAYIPKLREMYAENASTIVRVGGISQGLCGESRPHFFEGVATVVSKLLMQCAPDLAIFGEKDYQQLLVIRRMVRDLSIPVEIIGGPIVREDDGLAMSSRNVYLNRKERKIAGQLNKILKKMNEELLSASSVQDVLELAKPMILDAGFSSIDYLEIRDATNLEPLSEIDKPARIFAAVWMGKTRLIDNWPIGPENTKNDDYD